MGNSIETFVVQHPAIVQVSDYLAEHKIVHCTIPRSGFAVIQANDSEVFQVLKDHYTTPPKLLDSEGNDALQKIDRRTQTAAFRDFTQYNIAEDVFLGLVTTREEDLDSQYRPLVESAVGNVHTIKAPYGLLLEIMRDPNVTHFHGDRYMFE